MRNFDESCKDKYLINAKVILASIAVLNVFISIMEGNNIVGVMIQVFFGVLLYKGIHWVKYLFMIGIFLKFFLVIYLKMYAIQNQIITPYSSNIYFFTSLGFNIIIFYLLGCSKSVQYYINNKSQNFFLS